MDITESRIYILHASVCYMIFSEPSILRIVGTITQYELEEAESCHLQWMYVTICPFFLLNSPQHTGVPLVDTFGVRHHITLLSRNRFLPHIDLKSAPICTA